MLQDAFSLLAYSNPWDSPVGWQLEPVRREAVCEALNSAILGTLSAGNVHCQITQRLARSCATLTVPFLVS